MKYLKRSFAVFVGLCIITAWLWVIPADTQEGRRYSPQSFENPERAEWQKVNQVIQAMDLQEGDLIADIGGATGYFSRPFARRVGPKGTVYCCDLATNLLEYLQERAKQENLHNIVTVYAAPDRPMLPIQSIDFIFNCNTNHHLENRVDYYKDLKRHLAPDGKIVIVDWKKERQEVGPPPGHNLAKSTAIDELQQAGYELIQEETDLPYQYFLIFKIKH